MENEITFSNPPGWWAWSNGSRYPAMRGTLELKDRFIHVHEPVDMRSTTQITAVLKQRLLEAAQSEKKAIEVSLEGRTMPLPPSAIQIPGARVNLRRKPKVKGVKVVKAEEKKEG